MSSRKHLKSDPSVDSDARLLVRRALREDLGSGDKTTLALASRSCQVHARIIARHDCVVCGAKLAALIFRQLDRAVCCRVVKPDGSRVRAGQAVLRITGRADSILAGERTALNFMQRLTGIATITARFVRLARPYGVSILDTRKTTPGLRRLEKYAVLCGGGENHRFGLYDRILIKDNHRRLLGKGGLADAVRIARQRYPGVLIEVEVETEAQIRDVLRAAPDWVLLDNMPLPRLRRCVRLLGSGCRVEASGGIDLRRVRAVAATGVNAISLGCLTHSAPAADLSLEFASVKSGGKRAGHVARQF